MTDVPKFLPGKRNKFNPEFVKQWEPYLKEGMSCTQVAQIFGVAHSTVARKYPEYRWTAEQSLAYSLDVKRLNKLSKTL